MKRIIFTLLTATLSLALSAQTVTLKLRSGAQTIYNVSDIEYIDFTPDTGYVNLGLSVLWAKCNVGASSPEDYGNYYSWGEVDEKSIYADSTYSYASRDDRTGYVSFSRIGSNISSTSHDAAKESMAGKWRMPTKAEMQELVDSCEWQWGKSGMRQGFWVTGPSGAQIFLPAAGYRSGAKTIGSLRYGYYWTATYGFDSDAYCLCISNDDEENIYLGNYVRWLGRTIRPVRDK